MRILLYLLAFQLCCCQLLTAGPIRFRVETANAANHYFQVSMHADSLKGAYTDFKIPVWMPGYYQVMDYPENISDLTVTDNRGNALRWERADRNTWRVYSGSADSVHLQYRVKATRRFVASCYLDEKMGFVAPTGLFLHPAGQTGRKVEVAVQLQPGWKLATGLDSLSNHSLVADNFDILYDSPILMGELVSFPSFTVRGVPHYFVAWSPGSFDQAALMADLKKVVEAAVAIFDDIPYRKYFFLGIGPGGGGIEHLNSTAVSFSGEGLDKPEGRRRMISFLAHEYFHHFNAKRIRPIELGPFDYDHGSRTRLLWVAEGVTTYYDELLLCRAGLITREELLQSFTATIRRMESSPGRLFQSVTQASYDTWSDGPFGRTGDLVNKTVSYYEKGPVLALLLDFRLRHETAGLNGLDAVMRLLYNRYYREKGRGYTEAEFREACEQVAGCALDDFFGYVYTVAEPDYARYFGYAGLLIDTVNRPKPGSWTGIQPRLLSDTLQVSTVAYESPAWYAGILPGSRLLAVNGKAVTRESWAALDNEPAGTIRHLELLLNGKKETRSLVTATAYSRSFDWSPLASPGDLQQRIWAGWPADPSRRTKE